MAEIEIKRGYEVLPDNSVRFGVRVTNNGDFAISEVEVILDYNHSLFELEGSVIERLNTIPPSNMRTVRFILKPLGCVHNEKVGATVRYKDHKWENYTTNMQPKEVHCVYPFLKEKTITRTDFLKLFNEGYAAERGLNFENIHPLEVAEFVTHTCKNRLYKVDEFPIKDGKIFYFAADSIGQKAHYLLTAVVLEQEGIVQVLFKAKSDKEPGINGFLNEVVENLRHLVQSSSAAREIGIIKREQVINIIDSVVVRPNFGSFEEDNRKQESEEKLGKLQKEVDLNKTQKERGTQVGKANEELEINEIKEFSRAVTSKSRIKSLPPSKPTQKKPGSPSGKGILVFSLIFVIILISAVFNYLGSNSNSQASSLENIPASIQNNVSLKTNSNTISSNELLSVIDIDTNIVTTTVDVGTAPVECAANPDGTKVFVADYVDGTVSVINTVTNSVTATIKVGNSPDGVAVSPDGMKVYVTNKNDNNVSVIDTATNSVTATIEVGNSPDGVAVSPDGTKVYVTNKNDNDVSVIDTATNAVVGKISLGGSPLGVAVNSAGTKVYITGRDYPNLNEGIISIYDTATNAITDKIKVGNTPIGVAVNPGGTKVYVANSGDGTVSVIDTETNSITAIVKVGNNPEGVAVNSQGNKIYVVNSGSKTISIIDSATNKEITTINVGKNPKRIAVVSSRNKIYVTNN